MISDRYGQIIGVSPYPVLYEVLFKNSSLGVVLVVVCGVVRYDNKYTANFWFKVSVSPAIFFIAYLKVHVRTALSASLLNLFAYPLDAGLYGADLMWSIQFPFKKSFEFLGHKLDPLSETISTGTCRPYEEKRYLMIKALIVRSKVIDVIITLIHFE